MSLGKTLLSLILNLPVTDIPFFNKSKTQLNVLSFAELNTIHCSDKNEKRIRKRKSILLSWYNEMKKKTMGSLTLDEFPMNQYDNEINLKFRSMSLQK